MTPEDQSELFRQACEALGGFAQTSRILKINERSVSRYATGQLSPNSGVLADLCDALLKQAHYIREIEVRLNPMFAANRIPGQREPDGRARRWQKEGEADGND
jgi:hypothetical protein